MSETVFTTDVRIMSNGQVTIPQKIRTLLGVNPGDRVTFVVNRNEVRLVNSTIYALQRFQDQMKGKGESAGLITDEDIANWIMQSRREKDARR